MSQTNPLDEFNSSQINTNRKESNDVKQCFTTQTHQTIITCSAVLGIAISITAVHQNWYIIAITSLVLIALCLTTISVGCHKFNTANRASAYQIHLARIEDYKQNSNTKKKILANAIKSIDWEEAMFAYRLVHPMIYDFFYGKKIFKKGKKKKVLSSLKDYPWNDSRELINVQVNGLEHIPNKYWRWFNRILDLISFNILFRKKIRAKFYPGTYLRKMINKLVFIICLLITIYIYAICDICSLDLSTFSLVQLVKSSIATLFNISILQQIKDAILYLSHSSISQLATNTNLLRVKTALLILAPISIIGIHVFKDYVKCRRLESGLISIQNGAFVWRIVIITLLLAKIEVIKKNRKGTGTKGQIFEGYTATLAKVAKDSLYDELHDIHVWLNKKEHEIAVAIDTKVLLV